jgi:glutamate--cysteine ligase
LLYSADAQEAAWDLVKDWTAEERATMRAEVPTTALKTPFRNVTVRDIALEALRISHQGLRRRAIDDGLGRDETQFLNPLFQIAEANFTPAEDLLCAYHRRWGESVDPVFREYAY